MLHFHVYVGIPTFVSLFSMQEEPSTAGKNKGAKKATEKKQPGEKKVMKLQYFLMFRKSSFCFIAMLFRIMPV